MKRPSTCPASQKDQHRRFIETARELEADEDKGSVRGEIEEDRKYKAR
jgi:hypothetical protein